MSERAVQNLRTVAPRTAESCLILKKRRYVHHLADHRGRVSTIRPIGGRRKALRLVGRRGDEQRRQRIGRGLFGVAVLAHARLVCRQCVEGPRVERRLLVVETS